MIRISCGNGAEKEPTDSNVSLSVTRVSDAEEQWSSGGSAAFASGAALAPSSAESSRRRGARPSRVRISRELSLAAQRPPVWKLSDQVAVEGREAASGQPPASVDKLAAEFAVEAREGCFDEGKLEAELVVLGPC